MVKMGKWNDEAQKQPTADPNYREPARNAVITRIEKLEDELDWRLKSTGGFGKYAENLQRKIDTLSDELSRLRKTPEYRDFIAAKTRAITGAVEEAQRLTEEEERRRNTLTLPDNLMFKATRGEGKTSLRQSISIDAFKPK